jgi:hypothetical protein
MAELISLPFKAEWGGLERVGAEQMQLITPPFKAERSGADANPDTRASAQNIQTV